MVVVVVVVMVLLMVVVVVVLLLLVVVELLVVVMECSVTTLLELGTAQPRLYFLASCHQTSCIYKFCLILYKFANIFWFYNS